MGHKEIYQTCVLILFKTMMVISLIKPLILNINDECKACFA